MIYILTNSNDIVISITEDLNIIDNTYSVNGDTLRYPIEMIKTKTELVSIPPEIEIMKYCYTEEQGFYKNSNYKPFYSNEERISALEDMVNMILLGE